MSRLHPRQGLRIARQVRGLHAGRQLDQRRRQGLHQGVLDPKRWIQRCRKRSKKKVENSRKRRTMIHRYTWIYMIYAVHWVEWWQMMNGLLELRRNMVFDSHFRWFQCSKLEKHWDHWPWDLPQHPRFATGLDIAPSPLFRSSKRLSMSKRWSMVGNHDWRAVASTLILCSWL